MDYKKLALILTSRVIQLECPKKELTALEEARMTGYQPVPLSGDMLQEQAEEEEGGESSNESAE